jgi:phage terminase small subunit
MEESEIKALNLKHLRFCQEYLVDLCATQAAIRAGYSPKTASSASSRLLKDPRIEAEINRLKVERQEKLMVNANWVLSQAIAVHMRCMNDIRQVFYRDPQTKKTIPKTNEDGKFLYQFDAAGALKALELIGKHVAIEAFNQDSSKNNKNESPPALSENDENILKRLTGND